MESYVMKTFEKNIDIKVTVPGSKSITNRALLLAALSDGECLLKGIQLSSDSRVFIAALKDLGYKIEVNEKEYWVKIKGNGKKIPLKNKEIYVGSAGTAARFLTAMLALSGNEYSLKSSDQMKKRPMKELILALEQLGCKFEFEEEAYHFPFKILGKENRINERIYLNIDESSQFLSALLLCGIMEKEDFIVELTGKRSAKAYVNITMKMMEQFGCKMETKSENEYKIIVDQSYDLKEYQIEADVSGACYFYAMAAINGGRALVKNVFEDSMQGDISFLKILEKMGCKLINSDEGIILESDGDLSGIEADLSNFSDQTMTLAAVAPFAKEKTIINNIGHIRGQESDRISATVTELSKLGIKCEERQDGMTIYPIDNNFKNKKVHINTYNDHRIAMSFAVLGSKLEGIIIDNPSCCKKTFENFFDILDGLVTS